MKAYLVLDLSVNDLSRFRKYIVEIPAFIEKHSGKYIVRGGQPAARCLCNERIPTPRCPFAYPNHCPRLMRPILARRRNVIWFSLTNNISVPAGVPVYLCCSTSEPNPLFRR